MLAPLYKCPNHGEIWRVENTEVIDSDNDEIYPAILCAICFSDVTPVLHDGKRVFHALTDDEMFWEMYDE